MPDPLFPGRIGLYFSMLNYALRDTPAFAREHAGFYRSFKEWAGDISEKRVVDFGCGKTFWLTLLLASDGAYATGLDTEVALPGRSARKYHEILQENGFERMLRTWSWDHLFASRYYRCLEREFNRILRFDKVSLERIDGECLPLDTESVDFVVSHEVFEHVPNIDAAAKEISRILKPEGYAYIYVHHFTSLSGGHHIAWKHPNTSPSKLVPPWDHLRQRRFSLIPSRLNELRAHHYRSVFERYFDILRWDWLPKEGENLLTPEIRKELSDYSIEELLHKGFIVIARPLSDKDAK